MLSGDGSRRNEMSKAIKIIPENREVLLVRMIIAVVIVLFMFAVGLYLTLGRKVADKEAMQKLSDVIIKIDRNTDTIFHVLKTLAKNDSIMDVKLRHFPSSPPLNLENMSRVSSVYQMRIDPITGTNQMHWGIDYATSSGVKVYASAEGVVEKAGIDAGYGKAIKLNHEFGYETFYAHLKDIKVKEGQYVLKGQQIGTVGNTGMSTGSHLHYEILFLEKKINPKTFTSIY